MTDTAAGIAANTRPGRLSPATGKGERHGQGEEWDRARRLALIEARIQAELAKQRGEQRELFAGKGKTVAVAEQGELFGEKARATDV